MSPPDGEATLAFGVRHGLERICRERPADPTRL